MSGSLAPGALRDMGEAAFCASTHHKRWPQAALAGSPLSTPVQVPGQIQTQTQTQAPARQGTNSFDPTRIPSIVHIQDASPSLPVAYLFFLIYPQGRRVLFELLLLFLLQAASSFKLLGTSSPLSIFRYIGFFFSFFYILCIIHSFTTNDIRHSFVAYI